MKTRTYFLKTLVAIIAIVISSELIFSGCNKKSIAVADATASITIINTPEPNCIQIFNNETGESVKIKLWDITDITANSARATGSLDLNGDLSSFNNYRYGIHWDTIQNPESSIYHTDFKQLSENFSFLMYDLLPSTKYYASLCVKEAGTNQIHYAVSYLEFTTLEE